MCHCTPGIRTPCCGVSCHNKMFEEGMHECRIHRFVFGRPMEGEDQLTAAAARELAKVGHVARIASAMKDALSNIKSAATKGDTSCAIALTRAELGEDVAAALRELGFHTDRIRSDCLDVSWAETPESLKETK